MESKPKDNRTIIGLTVLAFVALIAWDWYACKVGRSTASKTITKSGQKHLIIPFLWGFITGHLFWSQKHLEESK